MTLANDALAQIKQAEDYNSTPRGSLRPSSIGQPLIQLILKDLVLPHLPTPESQKPTFDRSFNMNLGYFLESCLKAYVSKTLSTEATIQQGRTLNYKGISGSCDLIVFDEPNNKITLIECKCLGISTKAEAVEYVTTDNWGYLTQLSLYYSALITEYPGWEIDCYWFVWAKKISKSFKIQYPHSPVDAIAIADFAVTKVDDYNEVARLIDIGEPKLAAQKLLEYSQDLPLRVRQSNYYAGTCSLHFSPYVDLLVDRQGYPLPEIESNLELLIKASYNEQAKEILAIALTNAKH